MNDRIVKNPNFKNNGEFHRSLVSRGAGAKGYPNIHTAEADHLFVDLPVFQVKFHKGTAGYDEIWKDGRQVVADARWLLQDSAGKQVGIPQRIEWEIIDAYTLKVIRHYTDFLGTDFTVSCECRSDDRIKVTIEGVVGKSDTYNLVWSGSGIASPSVTHDKDLKRLSCFEQDIERPDVAFDYEDVYKQFGDITSTLAASLRESSSRLTLSWYQPAKTLQLQHTTIHANLFV